jgi:glycosyltransferase involved in cell wall biosynthesis
VTWGAIYPAKGLEIAIDALRRLGPDGGVTLDVYGEASDPAHGASLGERAAGLPVRFHGRFTPDQLERCSADFALLPSICHESYGLTLDEAASFGWPVLASDLPSYAERIAPAHGRTFRAGDPGALAALLRDPALDALTPAVPSTWSAADAARQLLDDYAAIRPGGAPPPPRVDATRRLLHLWRRAEWRLHVVLYHPSPYAPPDEVGA